MKEQKMKEQRSRAVLISSKLVQSVKQDRRLKKKTRSMRLFIPGTVGSIEKLLETKEKMKEKKVNEFLFEQFPN